MVQPTSVKLWTHWIVATCFAAVVMIGYVHGFVFTRTEGESLQNRHNADISGIRDDLREIRQSQHEILRHLRTSQ